MTSSPSKRPAVTYQRGSRNKFPANSDEKDAPMKSLLNPDVALQQKINDLLFSNEKMPSSGYQLEEEEEFDSAYHETTGNAKKIHDLVQVGETRRFIDEIEYLLDGLTATGPKSLQTIRSSLEEIVKKCFNNNANNVAFGMKLKSHGALGIIFESLNDFNDPIVLDHLILLLCALLYDVRRLDFFFKPELALKLARRCFSNKDGKSVSCVELKCTPVFKEAQELDERESFMHVGIWILYKWTFSSVTSSAAKSNESDSFFNLLLKETDLLRQLIEIISGSCVKIGESAAGLIDCLLNNRKTLFSDVLKDDLIKLLKCLNVQNIIFMKLFVSITGSPIGKDLSQVDSVAFLEIVKKLIKIALPLRGEEIEILYLSGLINLIDRCEDSILDEFRISKIEGICLLEYLGGQFPLNLSKNTSENDSPTSTNEMQKSLLALFLGFLCRQNRTNLQVMLKGCSVSSQEHLKREIFRVASEFALKVDEDDSLIVERLNEIIMAFKP